MERKGLKPPTGEVTDTRHSCKLLHGNTFLSRTPREEDCRRFSCCSSASCCRVEFRAFLRVSPEAQGHAQPFTGSSSLVKCLSVGNKTLPFVHLRTHLPLFHMASLYLTIALGAHEAADTIEMTSVAVPLARHSWPATKPCFILAGSLAVLFLSLQTLLAPSARSRDFANSSCKVSGDRAPLCCFSRLLVLSRSLKLSQNCSDFSLTSRNWSSGALTLRLVQPRPGDYFGMSAFPAHTG